MKTQHSPFSNNEKLCSVQMFNRVGLTSGLIVIEKLEILRRELRFLLEAAGIKVGNAGSLSEAINSQMERKDIILIKHISHNDLLESFSLEGKAQIFYTSTNNYIESHTFLIDKNLQVLRKFSKPYECRMISDEIIRNIKGRFDQDKTY